MPNKKLPNGSKRKLEAFAAMITTAAIWGVAGPVVRLTLQDLPVFTFLLFRFTLVALLVLPYLYLQLKQNPIDKRDLPNFIILGIVSQVSILLVFWGLKFTTALDAAVIGVISPVLTIAAGHYFYKERIGRVAELGILMATLGTLIIVIEPALSAAQITKTVSERILGNLLVLAYTFSWPAYTILGKRMMGQSSHNLAKAFSFLSMETMHKSYKPGVLTAVSSYVGLAFFIPAALIESLSANFAPQFTPTAIGGVLYMAVLSSIAAYGLYQWGVKYLEAQETAIFAYLGPIFTMPAAFLLLGELPTTILLTGAFIIALGVVIAEKYKA